MGLVKHITTRLEHPSEEGEWIEVRKLSRKEVAEARELSAVATRRAWREMGGDIITAINNLTPSDAARAERVADPFAGFDEAFVLKKAVIAWSYPDKPGDVADQVDDETADWLYREALRFSGIGRDEDERKNG